KVVEPAEAVRPQQMRQPVAPPLQFAIGQYFAAAGHDYGRLILPQPRMFTGVHRTSPCSLLSGRTATVRPCIRNCGHVNGEETGNRSAVMKWDPSVPSNDVAARLRSWRRQGQRSGLGS